MKSAVEAYLTEKATVWWLFSDPAGVLLDPHRLNLICH